MKILEYLSYMNSFHCSASKSFVFKEVFLFISFCLHPKFNPYLFFIFRIHLFINKITNETKIKKCITKKNEEIYVFTNCHIQRMVKDLNGAFQLEHTHPAILILVLFSHTFFSAF